MSITAPGSTIAPAAARFTRQPMALSGMFSGVCATLCAWRLRARERAELAVMDSRERRDLPHARDFDLRGEADKPFWRA